MKSFIELRSLILIVFFLVLTTGCQAPGAPTPATATATARVVETPGNASTLVAFPTSVPPGTSTVEATSNPASSQTATPAASSAASPSPALSASATISPTSASPIVQLVSPLTNTQVSVNQTFNVVVYAADDNGIARIDLFDDTTLVRSENAATPAPAVFSTIISWTPTQIGTHSLRAIAYDANGQASVPDEAAIPVTTDIRRPTSIIVYPIGIPQIEYGSVMPIYGVATDEVAVMQLDLVIDNQVYTYITSQNPNGQATFPFVFSWTALSMGNHTLLVRAHDNQDQTTDSAPLKILVVDSHTPSVRVNFERTNMPVNEPITITITALDVSGIQRVELWSGKEVFATISSPNPARQTSFTTQVMFTSPNPGDFSISARAYNANGNVEESPAQIVSVLRPGQATPTTPPTATPTRTRAPRATPTLRLQPPATPKAELSAPLDHFVGSSPLRVTFSGQSNGELDHIELWGYAQGQLNPQLICSIDAKASTQKTGQCDWNIPNAGVVYLYAQAVDLYRQVGRSALISGYISSPLLPTPTPAPLSVVGRWSASSSVGQISATLRQTGSTVTGDFRITGESALRIASGTVKNDRLTLSIESTPVTASPTPTGTLTIETPVSATAVPTPARLTMDFDCGIDVIAGTLNCTFKDSRGRSGSILLRRETTP